MMDEYTEADGSHAMKTALVLASNLLLGAAAMDFIIGVNGVAGADFTWQLALLLVVASILLRNGPMSGWTNLFAALLGVRMMDFTGVTPWHLRIIVGLAVSVAACVMLGYVAGMGRKHMEMAS